MRMHTEHDLEAAIERARTQLLAERESDGHWCYELEADCTIPSEYILMMHFMDEIDTDLQARMARYIRRNQMESGGWPLYFGGDVNISCTVKSYYALKLAGDDPDEPHMVLARQAILNRGGAARANVFTRIMLAQFGQVPWRAVPFIPAEIMFLPKWFPFHLDKVAYWSRTVMVPLFILTTLKVMAKNPQGTGVAELFTTPPFEERDYFPVRSTLNRVFLYAERSARLLEPVIPQFVRRRAVARAEAWMIERLNGEDGLGAIFPAMVNAYESLAALGYPPEHPLRATALAAIRKLVVEREDEAYCQPCVSPVWDTGLACHALLEAGVDEDQAAIEQALDWLAERQIHSSGDWAVQTDGSVEGGGWAFQYRNDHYPDLDDTAVVAWAMERHDAERYATPIRKAAGWMQALQSADGGFAAFDADNTHYHLNEIPFADHGALLDPPTADVSARVATLLARTRGADENPEVIERVLGYLASEQEDDGAWYGRWGTNYIYGTWSVLVALESLGVPSDDPMVRKAVRWLESVQRPDGGWGEDNDSYEADRPDNRFCRDSNIGSTSFQTAWALLGLMAAGESDSQAVRDGIRHLLQAQQPDGLWRDHWFTAPGFPRVFYLKYHGYSRFFPLWALARYRNLTASQGNVRNAA